MQGNYLVLTDDLTLYGFLEKAGIDVSEFQSSSADLTLRTTSSIHPLGHNNMKLGIDSFSTRNSGLDPVGVLGLAAELGLAGVLFELSPFQSFRDDDLARIRAVAEEKRLYLEFGMGSILHWHPMAEKGRQLLADAGYDIARLRRQDRHRSSPGRPEARLADPSLRGGQPLRPRRRARHGRRGR